MTSLPGVESLVRHCALVTDEVCDEPIAIGSREMAGFFEELGVASHPCGKKRRKDGAHNVGGAPGAAYSALSICARCSLSE